MTPTSLSQSSAVHRSHRRRASPSDHTERARSRSRRGARRDRRLLARYLDPQGSAREVLVQPGFGGSALVVDREVARGADRRLLAHLAADEPPENAALVCQLYLEQVRHGPCRCRQLTDEDSSRAPCSESCELDSPSVVAETELADEQGRSYRLEALPSRMSIPELRWCLHPAIDAEDGSSPVSVRDAVAQLQAYEPVRAITVRALAVSHSDSEISTTVLRAELQRVLESPILLNRRLREVVLATIARQELSMSEIAIRCGRVKRDSAGNESGETSWLARRLGILPEGGRQAPTPWIHSDVLALIARRGLGVSPREVELE